MSIRKEAILEVARAFEDDTTRLAKYLMDYWEDEINIDGDMYETEVDIAIRLLERLREMIGEEE